MVVQKRVAIIIQAGRIRRCVVKNCIDDAARHVRKIEMPVGFEVFVELGYSAGEQGMLNFPQLAIDIPETFEEVEILSNHLQNRRFSKLFTQPERRKLNLCPQGVDRVDGIASIPQCATQVQFFRVGAFGRYSRAFRGAG